LTKAQLPSPVVGDDVVQGSVLLSPFSASLVPTAVRFHEQRHSNYRFDAHKRVTDSQTTAGFGI
jgi:hypothetical protein